MAITYDGAGGLFTDLGKIVGVANNVALYARSTKDAAHLEIVAAFGDATMAYIEGLRTAGNDFFITACNNYRRAVLACAAARLMDPVKIVNELGLPSYTDLETLLTAFRAKMVADSKTVQRNVITLGSVTAGGSNVGNGTILVSKVLDGYSAPGAYFPADQGYNGLDSEMGAKSETLTVECTGDSQTSSRDEGSETFKVYGNPPSPEEADPTPYFGPIFPEGSGTSTDQYIVGPGSGTMVVNPGFDTWTSDTPPVLSGGWTIDNGTNDTHVKKETTNYYRGGVALRLLGDGAQATIQVSQTLYGVTTKLKPRRRYLVTVRYKASSVPAAGTLGIEFNGTGYTPGVTEKVSIAAGSLATSWTLQSFWVNTPSVLPTDWKIVVKATGTLSNGVSIYIDDLYVQPATYFGGVAMAVVPGSTRFAKGDKFTFTVANDRGGIIQTFWGNYFGRQLPSSGSPNISDSLADATAGDPSSMVLIP